MTWSLFGVKCASCGKRTRDAVLPPAGAGVGPQALVCGACSSRLKSEAEARAKAEAERREIEEANARKAKAEAEAKRREVEEAKARKAEAVAKQRQVLEEFETLLMKAYFNDNQGGDLEKAKALLNANPSLVSATDSTGSTPLHLVVARGYKDLVELLLAGKADVNAKDASGDTPLHLAAKSGQRNVAEMLLAGKARVDAVNNAGKAPLWYVTVGGSVEDVAELLRQYSAEHPRARASQPNRISEVICVSGPHMARMIVLYEDGTRKDAGYETGMGFGYAGGGPDRMSAFLRQAGFAFTDASRFVAPCRYRSNGTSMKGAIRDREIQWEDGSTTPIAEV